MQGWTTMRSSTAVCRTTRKYPIPRSFCWYENREYISHIRMNKLNWPCSLCTHYGIQSFRRVSGALGNGPKTLGNCFAECNTRHTIHGIFLSANNYLSSAFCRALGKAFAECRKSTRHRFTLGKMKIRKQTKNNSKNFFGGRPPPASVLPSNATGHRSRCIFCAKFMANAAGGIRTHNLSLVCLLLYHCTTLSIVSRFRYLSSYIILNRE